MKAGRRFEHRTRSGYTLMEMLIASVLIASLMSAAWNLLSLYSDFLSAGRESAATQQLARSLFDIAAEDLQQVSLINPETTSLSPRMQPRPPAFDLVLHSQPGPTAPGSLELIGTSSSLTLTLLRTPTTDPGTDSRPGNSLDELTPTGLRNGSIAGSNPSVPEIASIVYQFARSRISDVTSRSLPGGLHRIEMESQQWIAAMQSGVDLDAGEDSELDRSTLESLLYGSSADSSLPLPETVNESFPGDVKVTEGASVRSLRPLHEHIPEVVSCRFAYFDGSGWASNWDSRTGRTLPGAVRIELSLLTASDLQRVTASLQSGTIEKDDLDQTQAAMANEFGVGASAADESNADPFLAANPRRFERIILLSPGDVRQDRFEEAVPFAADGLALGGTLP
jgi:prepilin-type N-terminal cleavage/methylation domain-containing protein